MKNDSIPYYLAHQADTLKGDVRVKDFIKLESDDSFLYRDSLQQSAQNAYHIEKPSPREFHYGKLRPFSLGQTDGVFLLFVICLFFFGQIYRRGISFFRDNLKMFFSTNEDLRSFKQNTTTEKWNTIFFVFQFVVLFSIGIYDILWEKSGVKNYSDTPPFSIILLFIGLIIIFIIFKSIFLQFIGYIFDMKPTTDSWRRTGIIGFQFLGIIFFIPTLLLIYSQYWHIISIGLMASAFILVQIVLFYKIIVFFISKRVNFLYLIAYLCTVEILPYIFLAGGIFYLYRIDVFSVL